MVLIKWSKSTSLYQQIVSNDDKAEKVSAKA